MARHGHWKADLRHRCLHEIAFERLRDRPELRRRCLELTERWLASPEHAPARTWLERWREMLADWSLDEMAEVVLDPERGQSLRQCSPLAPALTPQQRWAALAEINQRIEREAAGTTG